MTIKQIKRLCYNEFRPPVLYIPRVAFFVYKFVEIGRKEGAVMGAVMEWRGYSDGCGEGVERVR